MPVEMVAHGNGLAGRLCMEIEENHMGFDSFKRRIRPSITVVFSRLRTGGRGLWQPDSEEVNYFNARSACCFSDIGGDVFKLI